MEKIEFDYYLCHPLEITDWNVFNRVKTQAATLFVLMTLKCDFKLPSTSFDAAR